VPSKKKKLVSTKKCLFIASESIFFWSGREKRERCLPRERKEEYPLERKKEKKKASRKKVAILGSTCCGYFRRRVRKREVAKKREEGKGEREGSIKTAFLGVQNCGTEPSKPHPKRKRERERESKTKRKGACVGINRRKVNLFRFFPIWFLFS
jgi:hypothetical protein